MSITRFRVVTYEEITRCIHPNAMFKKYSKIYIKKKQQQQQKQMCLVFPLALFDDNLIFQTRR